MGQRNRVTDTWRMRVCVCVRARMLREQGGEGQKQVNNCESWARETRVHSTIPESYLQTWFFNEKI